MFVRKGDSAWEVHAPAKLNLYLEVLGRRDDGFHELETLMTPVRIFDRLRWEPPRPGRDGEFRLSYDATVSAETAALAPADRTNLVWRAFDRLGQAAGVTPAGQVSVVKRIPAQAGLGGASSDAAAALALANAAWGVNYSWDRLARLGSDLGSDVPFFFAGGPAVCRGRGERVEPVAGLPRFHFVVVKPPGGVATGAAFSALAAGVPSPDAVAGSRRRLSELVDRLRKASYAGLAGRMVNRLQSAAARLSPWVDELRRRLTGYAGLAWQMTGSGSAWFGVAPTARRARVVAARISSWNLGKVFVTASYRTARPPL